MTDEYRCGWEDAVRKMTDRLKTYYNTLGGLSSTALIAFHIEQIAKEMLEGQKDLEQEDN